MKRASMASRKPVPWYRDPANAIESPLKVGWTIRAGNVKKLLGAEKEKSKCETPLHLDGSDLVGDLEPEGAGSNASVSLIAETPLPKASSDKEHVATVAETAKVEAHHRQPHRLARRLEF